MRPLRPPWPLLLACCCAAASEGSDAALGLIVTFDSYAAHAAHAAALAACVRGANGSHRVIERRTPAAGLPTDFLLVEFPPADDARLTTAVRVRRIFALAAACRLPPRRARAPSRSPRAR